MFGIQRLCRFGVFRLQKLKKKITVTENAKWRRVTVTGIVG